MESNFAHSVSPEITVDYGRYGGDSNEQWRAVYLWTDGNGNNVYRFVAQNDGLCLDVPGSSNANGQQLDQYLCNGTNAQAFTLVPVTPAPGNPVAPTAPQGQSAAAGVQSVVAGLTGVQNSGPGKPYGTVSGPWSYQNANSNYCIDVYGGQQTPGATIDQWQCASFGGPSQNFWMYNTGAFFFIQDGYGTFLEVAGGDGATGNGTRIDTGFFTGNRNQQWKLVATQLVWVFVSVSSGKCLDVPFSSTNEGQALDIWDCNGTSAQAFFPSYF